MTTLPLASAMTAVSLTAAIATASPNADFNNSGVVDSIDLVQLASQLNQQCEGDCPTDLNLDGITNSSDVLVLMQQWGPVPGWVAPDPDAEGNPEISNDPFAGRDMSWQGKNPVLLDSIYYEQLSRNQMRQDLAIELDQGAQEKAWTETNSVSVQTMVYHGGVDWNADGEYTDNDRAQFKNWMDENVPLDFQGPICLDMEGQWWSVFDTHNQIVMDVVLDFYIEGLEYAQSLRPNAKIGYHGLPKKSHTADNSTTASITRLLNASTALFPCAYEFNPNHDDSVRLANHVRNAIKMVEGKVPVYVTTSPRYRSNSGQLDQLHDVDELIRDQVDSSLSVVWTDGEGSEHRVSGVSLWDAYEYVQRYTINWSMLDNEARKELWDDLGAYHVELLAQMNESVEAACASAAQRRLATESQDKDVATTVDAIKDVVLDNNQQQSRLVDSNPTQSVAPSKSRLVRQIRVARVPVVRANNSYRSHARSYRSASRTWTSAKRKFAASARKYSKGSKQYNAALEEYKEAQQEMREVAQAYRNERVAYRASRANWNATTNQSQVNQPTDEESQGEEQLVFSNS